MPCSPREVALAWAAGIIDGEGCLFISRHKPDAKYHVRTFQYRLGLKVTMGHQPTVIRVSQIFGVGSRHRVEQSKKGFNTAYTWLAQARLLLPILDAIKPYCVTKSDEINVALEFLRLPKWYGGNNRGPKSKEYQETEYALWDRMRRLKPRTRLRLAKENRGGGSACR